MALFSRRRQKVMLDELRPWMPESKVTDVVQRLNDKVTSNALGAEAELALSWAASQATAIVIDPKFKETASRIDFAALNLFGDRAGAVEITAVSDDEFSGAEAMDYAADVISHYANRQKRRAQRHMHFTFGEESGYVRGDDGNAKYFRRRRVPPPRKFNMSAELKEAVRLWVTNPHWSSLPPLRLTDAQIDVTIRWQEKVHPRLRTFCTMPPIAYDLEDNPLYKRLEHKEDQLGGLPSSLIRCVFVADAGCDMLRNLNRSSPTRLEKNGAEIIQHFLRRSKVEIVCVFTPQRPIQVLGRKPEDALRWHATVFDKRTDRPPDFYNVLQRIAAALPPPQVESYQARSLHEQGFFDPAGGRNHLGYKITSRRESMTIQISARAVHDLLAGRLTYEKFQQRFFGDGVNQFDHQLKRGLVIKDVRLEPGGIEEDDDYIAFDLAPDVAATKLTVPPTPPPAAAIKPWLTRQFFPVWVWLRRYRTDRGRSGTAR